MLWFSKSEETRDQQLHAAAKANNIKRVARLLKAGADPEWVEVRREYDGESGPGWEAYDTGEWTEVRTTALSWAALHGNMKMKEMLLAAVEATADAAAERIVTNEDTGAALDEVATAVAEEVTVAEVVKVELEYAEQDRVVAIPQLFVSRCIDVALEQLAAELQRKQAGCGPDATTSDSLAPMRVDIAARMGEQSALKDCTHTADALVSELVDDHEAGSINEDDTASTPSSTREIADLRIQLAHAVEETNRAQQAEAALRAQLEALLRDTDSGSKQRPADSRRSSVRLRV